ncbi:MAG TPA: BTAD domain-containing putative transcriptional regulator [Symbiobacteriaceae bacterium]|nr:BTAD domain-containing putative transcriptional regulator [Symbiobacteriaceae bacterium]
MLFGEDQVLRAKLLPPRPRRHTLVRPRLHLKLREALEVPLTVLQAGPGYGKTTALASFLADVPQRVVWYSVAEGDADPLPFLLHLVYALRLQSPLIGEKSLSVLQEGEGSNRPWHLAVEGLINDMVFSSQPETLIVLDDFHLVDQVPAVQAMVEHLVEHIPPQVHLLLASRRRPPLPSLPKWRARAEVVELGEADLAFTRDEIEVLFEDQYGVDLTPQQAGELADRTEGWIIALQLIWQGLRKGSTLRRVWDREPSTLEALFAYLAQEVLDRQKPWVRRFLLTTAVLERLTPDACDALMGEPGSAGVLAALEENGLFIQPLGGGSYRYHQLFHQFLRERAQRDPDAWRAGHLMAARHFEAGETLETSAAHYLAAGEYARSARVIHQAAIGLLEAGRVDVLDGLLGQLPEAAFAREPQLLLRRGDVERLTSRFQEALAHYRRAAEAYRSAGDRRGLCFALQGQARVYLDTISPGDAEGLFREALQLADALGERERAQLMALVAENETNRGRPDDAARFASLAAAQMPLREDLDVRAHLRTGRLAAAMGSLERQARKGRTGASHSHREVPLLISLIAALMGDGDRARRAADEGIQTGRLKRSPFVEGVGFIRLGHALQLNPLSTVDEIAAQYHTAIEIMDGLRVVRGKSEPLAGLCMLYGHLAGDWPLARRFGSEGAEIAAAARDSWFHGFCLMSLGSSAYVCGRPEADQYLQEAEEAFLASGDSHGLALTRLWQAKAARRSGNWEAFDTAMAQALSSTQTNGYSFLFTKRTFFGPRDPQVLIPLLSDAHKRGVRADYAAWLLAELGIPNPEHHPGFTLRLHTLGVFQVWRGRNEIASREWQREKARQLMQLFVTNRKRLLQKEQIIDLLWPEADADTAYRDFKVALNALFNALEPNRTARSGSFYILRQGSAYGLNLASGFWLDADEFESLVSRGLGARGGEAEAAALLRQALDLYQGDFLEDAPYEDWCTEERERLQVLYLRAAEWLAQYAAREEDYERCIHLCDRILARDHCWEEAYRLLMYSYFRLGNRPKAMRVFDKCAVCLEKELGVKPMPTTVQLYERIRRSVDL